EHLCQEGMFKFEPSIPSVYVLVDRSGSMFHCLTGSTTDVICSDPANTAWTKLKGAVEMVMSSLETQVRFGFATFTGTDPAHGGTCPQISEVAPKLMNAAAIKAVYDPLPFPPNSNTPGLK